MYTTSTLCLTWTIKGGLVNGQIIIIIVTIKKGVKMLLQCSSPAFEKSPSVPAPRTATELNMLAGGERHRNGRGKKKRDKRRWGKEPLFKEQKGDMWALWWGRGPLTSLCHSDNQHLAFTAGVWSHQVIVVCCTSTRPHRIVLLPNIVKQTTTYICYLTSLWQHPWPAKNLPLPQIIHGHSSLEHSDDWSRSTHLWKKKQQFKIGFSNSSADYHNHFMADNTL